MEQDGWVVKKDKSQVLACIYLAMGWWIYNKDANCDCYFMLICGQGKAGG